MIRSARGYRSASTTLKLQLAISSRERGEGRVTGSEAADASFVGRSVRGRRWRAHHDSSIDDMMR
jgi:hypothetical protein